MLKKISLFIIAFIVLAGVGVGIYYFLSGNGDDSRADDGGLIDASPFGRLVEDINLNIRFPRFFGGDDRGDGRGDERDLPDVVRENETGGGFSAQKLRQLTSVPVAGAVTQTSPEDTSEAFYTERSTGHIFKIELENLKRERVANTTIPRIREVAWGSRGTFSVFRYLDENDVIKSFLGSIEEEGTLDGSFLQDEILDIAVAPEGDRFFAFAQVGTRGVGTIHTPDTSNPGQTAKKEVFSSPFTEWAVEWPHNSTVALTTKASLEENGYLYFLNTGNGVFNRVFGDVQGLTTLVSPDLKLVLYSESTRNGIVAKIFNTETNISVGFPLPTLPEKCVWSRKNPTTVYCGVPSSFPRAAYPDRWYQGVVSFSDTLWKINLETNAVDLLTTPSKEAREEVDLVHPLLSENEDYLLFINKKDHTLWSLKIGD